MEERWCRVTIDTGASKRTAACGGHGDSESALVSMHDSCPVRKLISHPTVHWPCSIDFSVDNRAGGCFSSIWRPTPVASRVASSWWTQARKKKCRWRNPIPHLSSCQLRPSHHHNLTQPLPSLVLDRPQPAPGNSPAVSPASVPRCAAWPSRRTPVRSPSRAPPIRLAARSPQPPTDPSSWTSRRLTACRRDHVHSRPRRRIPDLDYQCARCEPAVHLIPPHRPAAAPAPTPRTRDRSDASRPLPLTASRHDAA